MRLFVILAGVICLLAAAGASFAEESPGSQALLSLVNESGDPLATGTPVRFVMMSPAQSLSSGEARVAPDGTIRLQNLVAGKWSIGFSTPEHDVERLDLVIPASGPHQLVLKKRGWIEGRLVTGEGTPCADMPIDLLLDRVEVIYARLMLLIPPGDEHLFARTGTDGRFRTPGPISGVYSLCIQGAGCAALAPQTRIAGARGSDLGEVVMAPTGAVEIAFRKGTAPLAEVKTHLQGVLDVTGRQGDPGDFRQSWTATTDADGRVTLSGMLPGRWELTASIVSLEWLNQRMPPVTVVGGATRRTELALGGGSLAGVVVDEAGLPLEGAQVGIPYGRGGRRAENQPSWQHSTRSGADGTWKLDGLAPGIYTVGAWREGAAAAFRAEIAVSTSPGAAPVRLVLKRVSAARLTVRLVNPDRSLLAGAVVTLIIETTNGSEGYLPLRTDDSGLATQDRLLPGASVVTAHMANRLPCRREIRLEEGANGPLDFVMERGASVTGRVLDGAGAPVAGAFVEMVDGERMSREERWARVIAEAGGEWEEHHLGRWEAMPGEEDQPPGGMAARTAADGSFRIEAVPEGECGIIVRKRGFAAHRSFPVRIPSEEAVALGDLVLQEKAPTSGPLLLRLLDASTGRPAPPGQYHVSATSPTAVAHSYARIDGGGEGTVVGDIPYGETTLSVLGNGRACHPLQVVVTAQNELSAVEVKLSPAAAVAGWVLDPAGHPAVGAWLMIDDRGAGATDLDGKFAIQGLPPGDHVLLVTGKGAAPAAVEVRGLALGEARGDLMVRLLRPAGLSGRVVDSKGNAVADARVKVMSLAEDGDTCEPWWASLPGECRSETDADGCFRFTGYPPGTYLLVARNRGHGEAAQDFSLAEGESLAVPDLRLEE